MFEKHNPKSMSFGFTAPSSYLRKGKHFSMATSSKFQLLGLMSGTSLDGLDLAYCTFESSGNQVSYTINGATTVPYPNDLLNTLQRCTELSGEALTALDVDLGIWMGNQAHQFIQMHSLAPTHICSHGHTVFHQPHRGFTLQIGHGQAMAIAAGLPVINNFRTKDVLLGGQGAPLVPIGDQLLFGNYAACLNLGGISNVSTQIHEKRVAYDIGPCNMLLNALAMRAGKAYDSGGQIAASGKLVPEWLEYLEGLAYYREPYPKSLGYEWVHQHILSKIPNQYPIGDLLHTATLHIARQLTKDLQQLLPTEGKVLVTGGGAFNIFLMEEVARLADGQFHLETPSSDLVQFKEALVFAFLGMRHLQGLPNCLASVTGARHDSVGGSLWMPA
jgi:anhydro-N-acetylmuramic acid kinase